MAVVRLAVVGIVVSALCAVAHAQEGKPCRSGHTCPVCAEENGVPDLPGSTDQSSRRRHKLLSRRRAALHHLHHHPSVRNRSPDRRRWRAGADLGRVADALADGTPSGYSAGMSPEKSRRGLGVAPGLCQCSGFSTAGDIRGLLRSIMLLHHRLAPITPHFRGH